MKGNYFPFRLNAIKSKAYEKSTNEGVGYTSKHQEGWIYIRHQLRGFDIYQRQQGVGYMSKLQMDLEKGDKIKTVYSELFIKLKNTI